MARISETIARCSALFAAVHAGDVAALDVHFADPSVRAEVDETELRIAAHDPDYVSLEAESVARWYQYSDDTTDYNMRNVFRVAVVTGQVDVLSWFFSSPRIQFMRATLLLAWPSLVETMMFLERTEMMEMLLNVGGHELFLNGSFVTVMTDAISCLSTQSHEMIDLLLSHGADINVGTVLSQYDGSGTGTVDFLAAQGAFIVGEAISMDSSEMGTREEVCRLLELGVDAGSKSDGLLVAAAHGRLPIVELYLERANMDLDCVDQFGRSPVNLVAALNRMTVFYGEDELMSVLKVLLEAGVNPSVKDNSGVTALYRVAESQNIAMAKLLLEYGADPRDSLAVFSVFDSMLTSLDVTQVGFDAAATDLLLLLIRSGLDPHTHDFQGKTIVQHLQQLVAGRAFMRAIPAHFSNKTADTSEDTRMRPE